MNNKTGGALVTVLLVMLALTIITAGLFTLVRHNAVETIYHTQTEQAFWIAETGLQQTLHKILTRESYRDHVETSAIHADDPDWGSPYTVVIDDQGRTGEYDVRVWKSGNIYDIVVQANVGEMKSRLNLISKVIPGLPDYGIMMLPDSGNAHLRSNATVNGDLYFFGDQLKVEGGHIAGKVYVDTSKDTDLLTGIDADQIKKREPLPFVVRIDAFNSKITDASNAGGGDSSSDIDLNHYLANTYYVNGNARDFKNIVGPGTLVVSGNLEKPKNNFIIGDNVTILCGGNIDLTQKNGTIGTNVNLFAVENASIKDLSMPSSGGSSIVAGENLELFGDVTFSGLMYAGGNVKLEKKNKTISITGTIICAEGNFDMVDDIALTIEPDSSIIPTTLFDDDNLFKVDGLTSENTWNELSPL